MTSGNRLFGLSVAARERLLRGLRERQGPEDSADASAPATTAATADFARLDRLPGVQEFNMHKRGAERLGIASPFFRTHERVAGAMARIDGRELVNFANYNYLGLCGDERVSLAAKEAIDLHGTSASASRVVSGERPLHRALERALADVHGAEDAVVFVSGHATNVTVIGHLFGPRDLVVHDALIHNSVVQGAILSGARRLSFPHNDAAALDRLLGEVRGQFERVLIVVEGIYSMDGDFPPLDRIIEIKRRHSALLMVDEAHSLGVVGESGRGIGARFGISGADVDFWMGTLSKSLAACGGYIAGEAGIVDYLRHTAPGFLYSVGMSPPLAAAALKALEIMLAEPWRSERVREHGLLLLDLMRQAGLDTGTSTGHAVVPAIIGSSVIAARLSNRLFECGINVQPILHPAVEERAARLRFFVSCDHDEEQLRESVATLARELRRLQSGLGRFVR